MNRFSRINTIWRKELIDTLRDRRTLVAMLLVPIILYPALMLGSLQALQFQVSGLQRLHYTVVVPNDETGRWLRYVLDTDAARLEPEADLPAEELIEMAARSPEEGGPAAPPVEPGERQREAVRATRIRPENIDIRVSDDPRQAVLDGAAHVALWFGKRDSLPQPGAAGTSAIALAYDQSEIRSEVITAHLDNVLRRYNDWLLGERLAKAGLPIEFVSPIVTTPENIAPAERMAGSALGQIVPLILIVMTITGAIYPAIDLTAGERERGTLETLMVAPVPSVDLIAGKFIVVTFIALLSAFLNLASIGGTIWLGGVGDLLTQGGGFTLPIGALPWVMLLLVPMAVMFSAMLLAVCSFARSFKEAQNYVVPVMMAAMIPGVIGILPDTRLEGPVLIMPVANIVVLIRDLFLDRFDAFAFILVMLSTSMYAATAVAVAARLFGQEAVLFADSGSIKTLFNRKFFMPRAVPTAAQALLVLAAAYTFNFYIQQWIVRQAGLNSGVGFLSAMAITIVTIFAIAPWFVARYTRVRPQTAFRLHGASPWAFGAAICFGLSTWVLARAWFVIQMRFMPLDSDVARAIEQQFAWFNDVGPVTLVFFLALVPAISEELMFRGFALSGLQSGMGKLGAIIFTALAFGLAHYSPHRLLTTALLGLVLATLVVQHRSIFPAMIVHFMHNGLSLLAVHPQGFSGFLERWGWPAGAEDAAVAPPLPWMLGAVGLFLLGIMCCFLPNAARRAAEPDADEPPYTPEMSPTPSAT